MKRILIAIIAFFAIASAVKSQVGVFPQAMFLDPTTRSTKMVIINNSDEPKEVTIDLRYGYPSFDSAGKSIMNFNDPKNEKKYSLAPHVKLFPKKFFLKAKGEQVVKVVLKNVGGLSDGYYYTRVAVNSKSEMKQYDSVFKEGNVGAKFEYHYTIDGIIVYKKGRPECNVNITGGKTFWDSAGLHLKLYYEKGGEAPFYGTTVIKAYNKAGEVVQELYDGTPTYFNCSKSYSLDSAKFADGEYNFQIILTNEQPNIPDTFKIPFEPYVNTVTAIVKKEL